MDNLRTAADVHNNTNENEILIIPKKKIITIINILKIIKNRLENMIPMEDNRYITNTADIALEDYSM